MRIELITGGASITLQVILPEKWHKFSMKNARSFWLLHDKFDDSGDWISFTQAELFAEEHEFAVICPGMNSARYNDWVNGCSWQTYLVEDLWTYMHEMFPLSKQPEDNILFGFGRGGFGAVKYALLRPDKFGSAYSVSYDDSFVVKYMAGDGGTPKFGSGYPSPAETARSPENILWLAEQNAAAGIKKASIHMACGADEPVLERNIEVRDRLLSLGYNIELDEYQSSGGWRFCSEQLEKAMDSADT